MMKKLFKHSVVMVLLTLMGFAQCLAVGEVASFDPYNVIARDGSSDYQARFGVVLDQQGMSMNALGARRFVTLYYHHAVNCYTQATFQAIAEYYDDQQRNIGSAPVLVSADDFISYITAGASNAVEQLNAAIDRATTSLYKGTELRTFDLDPFCTQVIRLPSDAGILYQLYNPDVDLTDLSLNGLVVSRVKEVKKQVKAALAQVKEQLDPKSSPTQDLTKNTNIAQTPRSILSSMIDLELMGDGQYSVGYAVFLQQYIQNEQQFSDEDKDLEKAVSELGFRGTLMRPVLGKLYFSLLLTEEEVSQELRYAELARQHVLHVVDMFAHTYPQHLELQQLETASYEAVRLVDRIARVWFTIAPKFPASVDSDQ